MTQEQDSFLGICAHFLFDNTKNEPFLTVAISLSYPETTLSIQACYRLNCFNPPPPHLKGKKGGVRGPPSVGIASPPSIVGPLESS